MRMRPASLTAAAPPLSCHDTHKVTAVEISATSRKGETANASLRLKLHRVCLSVMGQILLRGGGPAGARQLSSCRGAAPRAAAQLNTLFARTLKVRDWD